MSLSSVIFAALSDAASDTAALVGSGANCRVYPIQAPAGVALPYVIFSHIASDPDRSHAGASSISLDLVQFSAFAETYSAAAALGDALAADLDGVVIATGSTPTLQDRRVSFETAVDLHRVDVDFVI